MEIARRKKIELQHKLQSLQHEFQEWRRQSQTYGRLEKHASQIRRITNQLESLQDVLRRRLELLGDNEPELLSEARQLEAMMLELHRIWEFFRSKLVLRSVEWFNPYLLAADEFAWACYSAAQQKLGGAYLRAENIKEPPLVFFSGGSSPFIVPRDWAFVLNEGANRKLKTEEFRAVLDRLPIPVIGVPWYQVSHLPEVLGIGHEVGHSVELDFALTERLQSLLEAEMNRAGSMIDRHRQSAWQAWLREIFADIYGVLATGPAYVSMLMDFLATAERGVISDIRTAHNWESYPTDYLRVLLNLHVLKHQGYREEFAQLKSQWESTYPNHSMRDFEGDIPGVVNAILAGPYPEFGNLPLTQVISYPHSEHLKAQHDAKAMLSGFKPQSEDVRTIFSAARLAFAEDPDMYQTRNIHSKILERVAHLQPHGTRGEAEKPLQREELERFDEMMGHELYSVISTYLHRAAVSPE